MRTMKTAVRSRAARIGVVLAVTAAGLVDTATPSFAVVTPATLTPSATQGPSGGTNTIFATVPVPLGTGTQAFAAGTTFVEFQAVGAVTAAAAGNALVGTAPTAGTTGCWPTWLPAYTPQNLTTSTWGGVVPVVGTGTVVFSQSKIFITVPSGLSLAPLLASPSVPAQTTAKYNICVYGGNTASPTGTSTGSPLIAQTASATGQYTIANKATFTSIVPPTGPAQGKTTITVNGANFTTAATMTATLGGMPLPILTVDTGGAWFTATVPSHTASATPVDLVVTTAGGSTTAAGVFTYTNGIVTSPDNEPNTQAKLSYIDIQGVGFSGLSFTGTAGLTPDSTGAHVYLVNGVYNPQVVTSPNRKKVGETAECVDVRVVSDTELICSPYPGVSIDPTTGTTALATHTLKVNYAAAGGLTLTPVAPDTFTAADTGLLVTGPGSGDIPTGTVITAVNSSTGVATIDTAVTGTGGTGVTVTVSALPFTATTDSTSTSLTVVASTTATSAAFGSYDVTTPPRVVSGAGVVPFNTTLASQNTAASTAVLSAMPSVTGASQAMLLGNAAPVPTGVYTVTVVSDGTLGSTTYTQSIISSGSTYTVAPY